MRKSQRTQSTRRNRRSRPSILEELKASARQPGFQRSLCELLVALCKSNTTPSPDIAIMRQAESRCFDLLERELGRLQLPDAKWERKPIDPAIAAHRHYSQPHYTKTPGRPAGLSAGEAYAGRGNLVFIVPGQGRFPTGRSVALNAHIDVVAPWFPPRVRGNTVHGRGACDDKGPAVAVIGALRLLAGLLRDRGLALNRDIVAMFVVDEETGGNGSLSLAIDRGLKAHYDGIVVCECTGLKIHPANRGAVWYQATLRPPSDVSALEMFAFINEEMEREGWAIRAESRHALFPQRPVQTCHGILGLFGELPSRICGRAGFVLEFQRPPSREAVALVGDCLDSALAGYVGLYGDKTQVIDRATGKPMVARHYRVRRDGPRLEVAVFGATGHMGAVRERDGAITKMAHLVRGLVASRARIESLAGGEFRLGFPPGTPSTGALVLEGGQGFVPTHAMREVMHRLRTAVERGVENYLRRMGRRERGADVVEVAYDRLHNEAFDGDPDSGLTRDAVAAATAAGVWKGEPILGWTVSCDARIFATEYPGLPVITFGPGQLSFAHSDHEQIELEEVRAAAECLAALLLRHTGTAA